MIALLGDIHGDFAVLYRMLQRLPKDTPLVQVGDFGYWPQTFRQYMRECRIDRQFLFIDGNHDDVSRLTTYLTPQEVWPYAMYVPRGTVVEVEGKQLLFVGGATSVDRHLRPSAASGKINAWFPEEDVTDADVTRALKNAEQVGKIDALIVHAPPISFTQKHLAPLQPPMPPRWGFSHQWPTPQGDVSAKKIEKLWVALDRPPLFCGHIHRDAVDGNVRVLDINQVYLWRE